MAKNKEDEKTALDEIWMKFKVMANVPIEFNLDIAVFDGNMVYKENI